jgi:hypothetical protein
MKKTVLFGASLLFIITSVTSCKKDYTCKCSKTYTTNGGSTTNDYSVYTYNDTKGRAVTRCNDNDNSGSDVGGAYSINCQIQ